MRPRTILTSLLLLFGTVGCDQVSKQAAIRWLSDAPPSSYLGDTFRLTYMENTGAFLGLGADWPAAVRWFAFTLLSTVFVVVASWALFSQLRHRRPVWTVGALGLALIVAGGIGNLIDRVTREGAVVDFMNLGVGSLRTGIFNVADVYIMLGAGLWLIGQRHSSAGMAPTSG